MIFFDIIIVFIIVILLIFFVSLYRFIFGGKTTLFDYEGAVEKATLTSKGQEKRQEKIKGEKTLIGTNGRKEIFIENNARHVFVCGTTGTGKTVALANFINSGVDYDYPMLILDGKGDTDSNSIYDIVSKLKGTRKVYVINLNDPINSDKYNPFYNTTPTIIKDMLINLTEFSEQHYKQNTERYLQRLINLLFMNDIKTSFGKILEYIEPLKFTAISAESVKKGLISKDAHLNNIDLIKTSGEIAAGATARFSNLFESDIGEIFDDKGIDIYRAIQEKAIILFILNPLLYPETSPLFGNLVIIDSKKCVSHLYSEKQKRVFFIFDEINVYATPSLLDLVNKSRSANVTCILAAQSLSDLDAKSGEYFKEQIIENCNQFIILRQNSAVNAEQFSNIIGTKNTMNITYQMNEDGTTGKGSARSVREYLYHPDDIKNLKMGHAIYVSKDTNFKSKINIYKCF